MNEIARFVDAFQRGEKFKHVRGCYGRIVRTRADKPPALAEEADRRVVMVMGPGALKRLSGCSGYAMLCTIGYKADYIERKLNEGFEFSLLLFARPRGWFKVANWSNTISGIIAVYPELDEILRANARALKTTSFAEFERQAGFEFAEIDSNGPADERFMTSQRLLESDRSALAVRRFLYHTTRLSDLYTGTGLTKTDDGRPGVREYIMANRPLSQLDELHKLAIKVELPGDGHLSPVSGRGGVS